MEVNVKRFIEVLCFISDAGEKYPDICLFCPMKDCTDGSHCIRNMLDYLTDK